jgi:hypothetical protein
MKKFIVLLAIVALAATGCSMQDGFTGQESVMNSSEITSNPGVEEIQLVSVKGISSTSPGDGPNYIYWHFSFEGYAKVKNLAYDKKVTVFYGTAYYTDDWATFDASYVKTLDDGYELWHFKLPTITEKGWKNSKSWEIALRYQVNGQEYWDNREGQNYRVGAGYAPYYPRTNLGDNVPVLVSSASLYQQYGTGNKELTVNVLVKNIAYEKIVKVRYTTDNWNSFIDADAVYQRALSYNSDTEEWQVKTTVDSSVSTVDLAVMYTVNGVTYWDNNFGENYTAGQ